jgi:cell division protein FtsA
VPHLADAASGPAFCTAAGVLHRAAFGPREAIPTHRHTLRGRRPALADPDRGALGRLAGWLSENF